MTLVLDHVMHGVADLDEAARSMAELGFHVVAGGQHPGWGTHNRLCYFDLTYLEWIAVHDESEADVSDVGKHVLASIRKGEGPITVAFRTPDLDRDVAAIRERGYEVQGPFASSRRRPDGSVVAWRLALLPWPWPFLIEWQGSGQERRADLIGRGVIADHPLGAGLRLEQVAWAVPDLAGGCRWLEEVYGASLGTPFDDPELGARCASSSVGVTLCQPYAPGPAQEALQSRGAGPFLYDLRGDAVAEQLAKPSQAVGAWIRIRQGGGNP